MISLRPRPLDGAGEYRAVRIRDARGGCFAPVVDVSTGRKISVDELTALADLDRPERLAPSLRRFTAVFVDESPLQGAARARGQHGVVLDAIDIAARVPLWYRADDVVIGAVDRVALVEADGGLSGVVVGRGLIGAATLNGSRLADVAWAALEDGVFFGVCCELRHQRQDAAGHLHDLELVALRLGAPEDMCCTSARVLRRWTAPRAARVEGLTDEELAAVEAALGQPLPALDDGPAFTLIPMPARAALAGLDDEEEPPCR